MLMFLEVRDRNRQLRHFSGEMLLPLHQSLLPIKQERKNIMYRKFLRTYTILGLMLCIFITPVHAGKYEEAFLDEVIKHSVYRISCRNGNDEGSKQVRHVENQQVKVGETLTPHAYGNYTDQYGRRCYRTEQYAYKDVVTYKTSPSQYYCKNCRRDMSYGWVANPTFQVKRFDDEITIIIKHHGIKGYKTNTPCDKPFKNEDLRSEEPLFRELYEGCPNIKFKSSWLGVLETLWQRAVELDLAEESQGDDQGRILRRSVKWEEEVSSTCIIL